ncbi:Crp/Fnr family transcriptional regulator [Allomuricauda sp. d1]|uniref:Crp/Fnr family transcriptional regulator n=1 Tax=Allomuricauda sp. d1 TaxID=3136725 RepID=UPI0031DB066C
MDEAIFDFLSKYIDLTKEEKAILKEQNLFKSFAKGTVLLKEGELAKECFFILKGCMYSYYLVDGEVKVTEFFVEQQPITPISYTTKKPSEYYLECLEDCIIAIGSEERTEELMRKIPRLAILGSCVLEDEVVSQKTKYDNFIKLSPEQRYKSLQKESPELLNRIPQYLIASYLGIKPESLSRIRKRMHDNHNSLPI